MTNINCTKDCVFQKDGLCSYDNTMLILPEIACPEGEKVCVYQTTSSKNAVKKR